MPSAWARVKQMTAVLTDLEGKILAEEDTALVGHDVESVTRLMVNLIHGLMRQAPPSPYGIIGIGVGVPGWLTVTAPSSSLPTWDGTWCRRRSA